MKFVILNHLTHTLVRNEKNQAQVFISNKQAEMYIHKRLENNFKRYEVKGLDPEKMKYYSFNRG